MDNTVENMEQGIGLDDAALSPVQESAQELESLEELIAEPETPEAPQPEEQPAAKKEPGWVKQRVEKATAKAVQETEARLRAEFQKQMAPLVESFYSRQADELVASGEFKSKERALEYVKLKNGVVDAPKPSEPAQPTEQPQQPSAEVKVRASMLAAQADKIKANRGVDVVQAIRDNSEMRQNVLSGAWDFYDVAEALTGQRRMPSPVRTPNGAGIGTTTIENMTDAQFKRLWDNIAAGKVYDAK